MPKKKIAVLSIADSLRAHIEASGMTYYKLSQASGVHQSVIGRFAKGLRGIDTETAQKLCEAFELTLEPNRPTKRKT